MENKIYKKQFTVGDMLSFAWEYFTKNWKIIFLITIIVYIPLNTILALVPLESMAESQGIFQAFRVYMKIIQLLELLIGTIAVVAIALVIKAKVDNKDISLKESLVASLKLWPKVIATNLLTGLLLFGLFIALIIPGIIFYVYWIFVTYVVVFNDKWGYDALKHSKAVVQNKWWLTLGFSMLIGLLMLIVSAISGWILSFIPYNFVLNIITDTIIDLALVYFTVLWIIFYLNFDKNRVKKVSEQAKQ